MSHPRRVGLPHLVVPGERFLSTSGYNQEEIPSRFWEFYTTHTPEFRPDPARRRRVFRIHVTLEEILGDQ